MLAECGPSTAESYATEPVRAPPAIVAPSSAATSVSPVLVVPKLNESTVEVVVYVPW
ncbi:MAG TPA: hypothetical protein VEF89_29155 [Solirubrobacteraceae bacterium]|nr:hypothetical protein [Solirubrobacteraceae bacterium]